MRNKLVQYFVILVFFLIASYLFLFLVLKVLKIQDQEPEKISVKKTADVEESLFYSEVERLASSEFSAEVYLNKKELGVYYQKGEMVRIDFHEKKTSYLYIPGVKKKFLLNHSEKKVKELFSEKEVDYIFDFYSIFVPYYDKRWVRQRKDLLFAQDKRYDYFAELKGIDGFLSKIYKVEKANKRVVEEIEVKYLNTSAVSKDKFEIPKDYEIVSMYER